MDRERLSPKNTNSPQEPVSGSHFLEALSMAWKTDREADTQLAKPVQRRRFLTLLAWAASLGVTWQAASASCGTTTATTTTTNYQLPTATTTRIVTQAQYLSSCASAMLTSPERLASYIVFVDPIDQQIKSKNGLTGEINYAGTDASAVIQETINALETGGTIALKNGVYNLSTTLNDGGNDNIILTGEGWGTTLFVLPNSQLSDVINVGSKRRGWIIRNLAIDATNQERTEGNAGVRIEGEDCIVSEIYATQVDHGAVRVLGQSNTIVNCHLVNNVDDGIILSRALDSLIIGNTIRGTANHNCISLVNAMHVAVVANSCQAPHHCGIALENLSGTEPCVDVLISGNLIKDAGKHGILAYEENDGVESARDCIIQSNIIKACGTGIRLASGLRVSIINNLIDSTIEAGITTTSQTYDAQIVGNRIVGPGKHGICSSSGSSIINGNTIVSPASGHHGIDLVGVDGFIVMGNHVRGSDTPGTGEYATAIYVEQNSAHGSIIGNYLVGDGSNGIYLSDSATDVSVIGNYLERFNSGLREGTGCDNNVFIGNNIRNKIAGKKVALTGAGTRCMDNIGYNPAPIESVTVGDSPFFYTNNDGYRETIRLIGGEVSGIALVRGEYETDLGEASGAVLLEPGDAMIVTYTAAPAMIKIPH